MTFHLHTNEPVAPGLRRIAHEQIRIALENFADEALGLDEQVHSLRTRCKKMRGLLQLPRPIMGDAFDVEDGRFRAAARELASYRDRNILNKVIRSLGGQPLPDDGHGSSLPAGAIERSLGILSAAQQAVDGWSLGDSGFPALAPGFAQTYRKCLDKWQTVRRDPTDKHFHKLRKWTKYHWYQVRILERFNKSELRERRQQLRELQGILGEAHDFVLLEDAFSLNELPDDAPLLERALARKEQLYGKAMAIGHSVFSVPERVLVSNMTNWWRGWQQPGS